MYCLALIFVSLFSRSLDTLALCPLDVLQNNELYLVGSRSWKEGTTRRAGDGMESCRDRAKETAEKRPLDLIQDSSPAAWSTLRNRSLCTSDAPVCPASFESTELPRVSFTSLNTKGWNWSAERSLLPPRFLILRTYAIRGLDLPWGRLEGQTYRWTARPNTTQTVSTLFAEPSPEAMPVLTYANIPTCSQSASFTCTHRHTRVHQNLGHMCVL